MHLTLLTDFALRVLVYLAKHPDRIAPASEIAREYQVSNGHVAKAAKLLARHGYLATRRGKLGGLQLARPAETIRVGEILRRFEPTLDLLDCFDAKRARCQAAGTCRLRDSLIEAREAFMGVLDSVTLADLARPGTNLALTPFPARA